MKVKVTITSENAVHTFFCNKSNYRTLNRDIKRDIAKVKANENVWPAWRKFIDAKKLTVEFVTVQDFDLTK